MLSIFSCTYWPSVCLLWRNVSLGLLPMFWLGCLFFSWWVVWCSNLDIPLGLCLYGEVTLPLSATLNSRLEALDSWLLRKAPTFPAVSKTVLEHHQKNLAIFRANHTVPGIYPLFGHSCGECSPGLPHATAELTSQSITWTNSPGCELFVILRSFCQPMWENSPFANTLTDQQMTNWMLPKDQNPLGVVPMVSLKANRINKILCKWELNPLPSKVIKAKFSQPDVSQEPPRGNYSSQWAVQ